MVVTKGYGVNVQDINLWCPNDLKPYIAAYKLEQKTVDERMWQMGIYVQSAVGTAVEHCLAGHKARSKYIEEPISETIEKKNGQMSESERQRQLDALVKSLDIAKANFDRMKAKERREEEKLKRKAVAENERQEQTS